MGRPKGSKNKPKYVTEEKNVLITNSEWKRPTHYFAIVHEINKKQSLFTYTENESAAYSLCKKLNSETNKGKYVVHKLPYNI